MHGSITRHPPNFLRSRAARACMLGVVAIPYEICSLSKIRPPCASDARLGCGRRRATDHAKITATEGDTENYTTTLYGSTERGGHTRHGRHGRSQQQPTPRHEANTWPLHFTHTRVWVRRHPLSRAPLPPCIIHTSPWSAEPRARRDIPVAAVHGRCHPATWRAWALGGHRLPTRPRRLRGTDDLLVLLRRQRHAGRHD